MIQLDIWHHAPRWIVRPVGHDTLGIIVRAFTRDEAIAKVGRGEPELCMLVDEFDASREGERGGGRPGPTAGSEPPKPDRLA